MVSPGAATAATASVPVGASAANQFALVSHVTGVIFAAVGGYGGLGDLGWLGPSRRDGVKIKMVLHLPRDVASVPVSRQVLDGCLQTLGVTPDTRSDIALALSEACANVVQHAGPGQDYQVQVTTRNGKCSIEVVNTRDGTGRAWDRDWSDEAERAGRFALPVDPVAAIAEHGRGLKIINAVAGALRRAGPALIEAGSFGKKINCWDAARCN